jgi:hypothetical protein
MLLMTAVAQPTPVSTNMASTGQLRAHAPHSMQKSRSDTAAFLPETVKTPLGQTVSHIPQPVHFSESSSSETTFLRYTSFPTLYSRTQKGDEKGLNSLTRVGKSLGATPSDRILRLNVAFASRSL